MQNENNCRVLYIDDNKTINIEYAYVLRVWYFVPFNRFGVIKCIHLKTYSEYKIM